MIGPSEKPTSSDRKERSLITRRKPFRSNSQYAGKSGVPTKDIGPVQGKRGKAIRAALDAWSRRIGLVTEESIRLRVVQRSQGTRISIGRCLMCDPPNPYSKENEERIRAATRVTESRRVKHSRPESGQGRRCSVPKTGQVLRGTKYWVPGPVRLISRISWPRSSGLATKSMSEVSTTSRGASS